jgi:hypothetical protein
MSPAHPLNFSSRAVRSVGVRAGFAGGAGLPSILYNHVNRSFLWGRGLLDPGVLVARPFFVALMRIRFLPARPLVVGVLGSTCGVSGLWR